MTQSIPAPERFPRGWRTHFSSDGSVSTGSKERDGRPFIVLRQLTLDEADPSEDGHVPLWVIQFADDGSEFTAWNDEITYDEVREGEEA